MAIDTVHCDPRVKQGSTVLIDGKIVEHSGKGDFLDKPTFDDVLKNADGVALHDSGMARTKKAVDGEPIELNGGGGTPYVLPAATTAALGGVKQAAKVDDAAGDTVTKAEYNALLAALRTAGVLAK